MSVQSKQTNSQPHSAIPNSTILTKMIEEFAETLDEALLPRTTISGLGLKLSLMIKPAFQDILQEQQGATSSEAFAKGLVRLLASEFGYIMSIQAIEEDHVSFHVARCPFKGSRAQSLCSIMGGVIGGFGLMHFGYCKVQNTPGFKDITRPCVITVFLKQTPEVERKPGLEYTKDNVIQLQEEENRLTVEQRQSRRKLILGMFSKLAFSLRDYPSEGDIAKRFISGLSTVPGVMASAVYFRRGEGNEFALVAHYGFPDNMLPLSKKLSVDAGGAEDEQVVSPVEEINYEWSGALKRYAINYLMTIKISSKDNVNGILTIGWDSPAAVTTEVSEALRAACVLLGTAIDGTRLYFELEKAHVGSISIINQLANMQDRFASDHANRVASLAEAIAKEMGLSDNNVSKVYQSGMYHDIGKIGVPYEILNKPEKLTPEEFEMVKKHTEIGANVVAPVSIFKDIVPAILYHHERLDGSGYPEGLTGEKIPLYARIVGVADVYDAMVCTRAYRGALGKDIALKELRNGSGTRYDAEVVAALERALENLERSKNPERDPEQLELDLFGQAC